MCSLQSCIRRRTDDTVRIGTYFMQSIIRLRYEVMPGRPWPDLERQIQLGRVKGSWPDAREHWGTYRSKLEVVFIVRIPTKLDPARIVPGRNNVFIVPVADCVPGEGTDRASYFSNQMIQACLVLRSPDNQDDRKTLDALASEQQPVRVQCLSGRDAHHGMINTSLRKQAVDFDERLPDVLENRGNWCKATLGFTANVARRSTASREDSILQLHERLHARHAEKRLHPEDIARLSLQRWLRLLAALIRLCHTPTHSHFTSQARSEQRPCARTATD